MLWVATNLTNVSETRQLTLLPVVGSKDSCRVFPCLLLPTACPVAGSCWARAAGDLVAAKARMLSNIWECCPAHIAMPTQNRDYQGLVLFFSSVCSFIIILCAVFPLKERKAKVVREQLWPNFLWYFIVFTVGAGGKYGNSKCFLFGDLFDCR